MTPAAAISLPSWAYPQNRGLALQKQCECRKERDRKIDEAEGHPTQPLVNGKPLVITRGKNRVLRRQAVDGISGHQPRQSDSLHPLAHRTGIGRIRKLFNFQEVPTSESHGRLRFFGPLGQTQKLPGRITRFFKRTRSPMPAAATRVVATGTQSSEGNKWSTADYLLFFEIFRPVSCQSLGRAGPL